MGNTQKQTSDNFHLISNKVLSTAKVNQEEGTLEVGFLFDSHADEWKYNLHPIKTYNKYLFLPLYVRDRNYSLIGCQPENKQFRNHDFVAGYQPFVYTLANEIETRRNRSTFFTQKQIIKLTKCILLGVRKWDHAYPDISLGPLNGHTVLLNDQGHPKLLNIFSFPPEYSNVGIAYSQINPRMKNQTLADNKNLRTYLLDLRNLLYEMLQLSANSPSNQFSLRIDKIFTILSSQISPQEQTEEILVLCSKK